MFVQASIRELHVHAAEIGPALGEKGVSTDHNGDPARGRANAIARMNERGERHPPFDRNERNAAAGVEEVADQGSSRGEGERAAAGGRLSGLSRVSHGRHDRSNGWNPQVQFKPHVQTSRCKLPFGPSDLRY
jgi:hypothetical protein